MSFSSVYPSVEIPAVSVFDYLFGDLTAAERERPVFVGADGVVSTYGRFVDDIEALAGALAHREIGVGDVVGLYAPNSPQFAVAFHAVLRAGATVTTVNALYTPGEVAKQLTAAGAGALLITHAGAAALEEVLPATGIDEEAVFTLDGVDENGIAALIAEGLPAPQVEFDPATHLAVLPYSSGTTGAPKGVRLSHTNLVANVAQTAPMMKMTSEDVVVAVLPFFHIYGLTVLLDAAVRARAALVTMPRFDLPEFLELIQATRSTYVFIAPPVAVALAKHPLVDRYDLSSISTIVSGAAPLDENLAAAVAARLGCEVGQGFGMSEMSPVSHVIPRGDKHAPRRSVGLTVPNMICKIVDPATGREVDYPVEEGESASGELWRKGPNVMLGYLDNDAATAETIDADGFLHTGDLATVDADGYVTIVDRLKELIKYKGYQVPPAELEAVLLGHPQIADAAVIGIHDEGGEEVPQAFVVLQPGAELSAEEVMDYVAARVAPYKKIRHVQFIDTVPKSSAGKILRRELRERS